MTARVRMRTLCVFLLVISLFSLSACGKQDTAAAAASGDAEEQYIRTLSTSFDNIYKIQKKLTAAIADGTMDEDMLFNSINSLFDELHVLSSVQAPNDTLAEAQKEFADAADICDSMKSEIFAAVSGDSGDIRSVLTKHAFDLISVFDHLRYGMEVLTDNGYTLPDSAADLTKNIQDMIDSQFSSFFH